MSETSMFWDGTITGDATSAPYDAATVFAKYILEAMGMGGLTNLGGVLSAELNSMLPTVNVNTVSIASGRGFVDGTFYESTAPVTFVLPVPVSSTRVDLIVLEKSWVNKQIRLTKIAGVEGGGAPAMNQSLGNLWDIPIAQISTTTGGVSTLTDTRGYVTNGVSSGTSGLPLVGNGGTLLSTYQALTATGLASNAVTSAKIAAGAVTAAKLSGLLYLFSHQIEPTSHVTRTTTGTTDLDTGITTPSVIANDIIQVRLMAQDLSVLWSTGGIISAQMIIARDGVPIGDGPRLAGVAAGTTIYGNGLVVLEETAATAGLGAHNYKGQLTVVVPGTGSIEVQVGQISVDILRQS